MGKAGSVGRSRGGFRGIVVEKAVSSRMDVYVEEARLALGRRSNFEARVVPVTVPRTAAQ